MNLENISKQQLFREITELMQPLYFPVPYEENNIQEVAQQEYKLFCKLISAIYGFEKQSKACSECSCLPRRYTLR